MNYMSFGAIRILGTRIHMVEIKDVVCLMEYWIENEKFKSHHIVNSGMHGIMEARKNPNLRNIFESVSLFAPDGILMVLLSRLKGFHIKKSNTGPDLLWEFARIADKKGYKFYFYGDTEEVLRNLETRLEKCFPNLNIVGFKSPPFRPLTVDEDASHIKSINRAKPDVVWVGLGMPKQELWIAEHLDQLTAPILVGAGAALKFGSGDASRGPTVLRNLGLEWVWRLASDPKRIWKRVFIDAPHFIVLATLELLGIIKY